MSSLSSTMASATLAPGQLEGQPLPSGSASVLQILDGSTGKDTQSFQVPSGPLKQPAYWEGVPIWSADLALNSKPLSTPQRSPQESQDHGESENLRLARERVQTSTTLERPLRLDYPGGSLQSSSHTSPSSSPEVSNTRATHSSSRRTGAKSAASTSSGRQAQASHPSSTELMATAMFTLSQARGILGSTSTMANQFSSLTSIRTVLNSKRSLGGWTDTLSKCKSKELTSLLAGLTSTSSRTTTGTSSGTKRYRGGSTKAASSSSSDQEATTTTWRGTSRATEIDLCESSNEEEESDSSNSEDEEMINDEETDSDYECYGDYD